jgi:hypothetical protein
MPPWTPQYGMDPGFGLYPQGSYSQGGYGQAAAGGSTSDPYGDWLNTPIGQRWDQAQESAAAYARKQADFDMQQKKRELDARVQALRLQGRQAEAEIALKRGDQQIAKDRLAQELQIHQQDLQQRQLEFGQEFGLKRDQLGLDRAKAYTEYASTPSRLFMLGDLQDALTRAGQGLGPQPYGAAGEPIPKTYEGFQALAQPPGVPSAPGGSGMLGSGQLGQPGATSGPGPSGPGPTYGSTTDPRTSAISSVLKASPPSDEYGLDANDSAALQAVQNIIKMRRPGTLQRMRPGQQEAFMGGAARLGYVPGDVAADFRRSAPGQGSTTSVW